ncbi:hypothetical protein M413DRAFT_448702 [Hebeloma cylindrosporum]|uniref:Uncharacterized protein n=1 Tax=Hebeloma cylindrosporum TaxID=76867 RepID=A0A0C2XH77_HEBCY|nr:hypothetical protein M413DRAFT_448702 [Hebeloma cylindrosporum h7]
MGFSILLDDTSPWILSYYGTQWVHDSGLASALGVFNNTLSICHTEIQNTTSPPKLSIDFYGSEINLYGPVTGNIAMNYTIDGTSVRPAVLSSDAASGKRGIVNIWNVQGLSETVYHTMELFPSNGLFTLDYITIAPTKYSVFTGFNLIIDDADPALHYSGNWTHSAGEDFALGSVLYERTMTGTNMTGSTLRFDFIGSSVTVYGLLNQQAGKLTAAFSVDGKPPPTKFTPFDGSQTVNTSSWLLSQRFFHQDLVPGNHSLLVTLDEITDSQTLWIDSIVFEGTSSTTIGQPSNAGTGGTNAPTNNFPNGAIVGLVIAFLFILFTFAYLKERVKRYLGLGKTSNAIPTQSDTNTNDVNQNMTSNSSAALLPTPPQWSNAGESGIPLILMPTPTFYSPPQDPYPGNSVPAPPYGGPHPAPIPPRPPSEGTSHQRPPAGQETDAGPAEPPPPYNANLYIP